MVRPGRDLLTGRVEVDECYLGGLEEGLRGRLIESKAQFTFRSNRRKSASRGKLFYRLVQQAVVVEPSTYDEIVGRIPGKLKKAKPQALASVLS